MLGHRLKAFAGRLVVVLFAGIVYATNADAKNPSPQPPIDVRTGDISGHPNWKYWEIVPDLSRTELRIVSRPGGTYLESLVPQGAWAALNGGFWARDYRPTGWVQDARGILRARGKRAHGGVVAVDGKRVYVGDVKTLSFAPKFAIQNSPILIEQSGNIGIHSDDGRRASRTIACRTTEGILRFIVIIAVTGEGPTLLETAKILAETRERGGFACSSALNLDGGPSSGLWLRGDFGLSAPGPLVPIGYGIAIMEAR